VKKRQPLNITLDGRRVADDLARIEQVTEESIRKLRAATTDPTAGLVQIATLATVRDSLRARMPEVIADLRAKAKEHDAPRREAGYTITNLADGEAVVRIYDEIWDLGVNALDLAADLDGIDADHIRVEINSPGGSVFDGIAIYNALRNHPAHVTTRVDGIAASIASVIAQAGDTRIMVTGSQMMIHNAWGMTVGDRNDHTDMAAVLGQQDEVIASIYAARSGKPADEFRALMDAETWLTAERAVEAGLADEVYEPPSIKDKAPTLAAQIAELASSPVLDDVERLVADHGEPLTGAKHLGLVALRARLDGILNTEAKDETEPAAPAELLEEDQRRIAARRQYVAGLTG
jgi:ATP-dependent Clp endopeptidase proteolytic subunit ClpP